MSWSVSVAGLSFALVAGVLRLFVLGGRVRLLEGLAITDALTGAYNRRHLDECLSTAIQRRARHGESAALLLMDVDRFKEINDSLGHAAGDRVLKSIAAVVRSRARRMDALFRSGGEEFALLLTGADLRDATAVAEELRLAIERSSPIDGGLSVSIGVSDLDAGHTAESWLHDADVALYLAKRAGRNRVAARDGHIGVYRSEAAVVTSIPAAAPFH